VAKSKSTGLRRLQVPQKPTRVTDEDLMRWWAKFVDGQAPFMIAESESKEISSIEKGLAYIAYKLGPPDVGLERCRLIEQHHKALVALNDQLDRSRKIIESIDVDLTSPALDFDMKDKLRGARVREMGAQTKLFIEIRNVATALESLFQLKTVAIPTVEEEAEDLGTLDRMSHAQILKLIEEAERSDEEALPADEIDPTQYEETDTIEEAPD
jgi:hypothetical protein